jgi:Rhodopirellula transposase DDE domain
MLSPMLLEILRSYAGTTTDTGLKVRAELDDNKYPKGVKVCDAQIEALNLSHHSFDGDRCPRPRKILAKGEVDLLIYGHASVRCNLRTMPA